MNISRVSLSTCVELHLKRVDVASQVAERMYSLLPTTQCGQIHPLLDSYVHSSGKGATPVHTHAYNGCYGGSHATGKSEM